MAKSKKARKAQKAQQRNAKQRQVQQFQQVQQSNKNKQVQELRAKYQPVIDRTKAQKDKKPTSNLGVATTDAKSSKTAAEAKGEKNNAKTLANKQTKVRTFSEPVILEKTELKAKTPAPTLEDWQAKQRKRIEEAYEKKQEELKLKEVEFELQAKPKRNILRPVLTVFATILLLLNLGLAGWTLAQDFWPTGHIEVPHVGASDVMTGEIDFDQEILADDGSEFVPTYRLGAGQDLVMKFANLECTDDCENVQDVMLDNYYLATTEYGLAAEPATIVLYAEFLESLAPNSYTLTFDFENEGQTKKIGVVLTIEKIELVCEEGQVLQGETCVDEAGNEVAKPKEKVINYTENAGIGTSSNNQDSQNSNNGNSGDDAAKPNTPATPNTPDKSDEQIACERKIGPTKLTIIHWASEQEKAENRNAEVYVASGGFTLNATGAARMAWVNGVCRPAVSQSGYTGAGNYLSSYRAQVIYGAAVSEAIVNNPGQDVLIWTWKNGSTTTELIDDARAALNY